MKLERSDVPLVSHIERDAVTMEAIAPFDLNMDEETKFFPYKLPAISRDYNIALIVGSSGSGKSLLTKEFVTARHTDETFSPVKSIAAHFESAAVARDRLHAVGMNSIPKWRLPYNSLSCGEQHRVSIARNLHDDAVIDEFTSVVDRNVARSLSTAVARYIRKHQLKRVIFASCHRDIVPFLKPDWIIDTDAGEFIDVGPEEKVGRWWSEYVNGDYAVGTIHYS